MIYHLLNGDALRHNFPEKINGELLVCRECLIDGPLQAGELEGFFTQREKYLADDAPDKQFYREQVVPPLHQLLSLQAADRLVLWFEHDLFCQANMWFAMHLLNQLENPPQLERVLPPKDEKHEWQGFASRSSRELLLAWEERIQLSTDDLTFGNALWDSYSRHDLKKLKALSGQRRPAFPRLQEVVHAHLDRFPVAGRGRPEQKIAQLRSEKPNLGFPDLFREFSRSEGIYGFGDLQVKKMLERL